VLNLTRAREARRWSRAELGRQARVHPARVGQVEAGRVLPYPRELQRIADALEWQGDANDLLNEADGRPAGH